VNDRASEETDRALELRTGNRARKLVKQDRRGAAPQLTKVKVRVIALSRVNLSSLKRLDAASIANNEP